MTPDGTGDYAVGGIHNGKSYYVRNDNAYKIWWNNIDTWIISADLDVLAPGYWGRISPDIVGIYINAGTYLGLATVAEI